MATRQTSVVRAPRAPLPEEAVLAALPEVSREAFKLLPTVSRRQVLSAVDVPTAVMRMQRFQANDAAYAVLQAFVDQLPPCFTEEITRQQARHVGNAGKDVRSAFMAEIGTLVYKLRMILADPKTPAGSEARVDAVLMASKATKAALTEVYQRVQRNTLMQLQKAYDAADMKCWQIAGIMPVSGPAHTPLPLQRAAGTSSVIAEGA